MKTAGIVTFSAADSFGALMQCYALKKKLADNGYDVSVINYWPAYLRKDYKVMFTRQEFMSGVHSGLKCLWRSVIYIRFKNLPVALSKKRKMNQFRKKNLNVTRRCKSISQIRRLNDFDVYIAGSDQIWNSELTGGKLDPVFFLDFVKDISRKKSYAASTGKTPDEKIVDSYKDYLDNFSRLSVREKKSAEALRKITSKEILVEKDPTLLLSKEEWDELANTGSDKKNYKDYILFFSLYHTPEQFDYVNKLSEQLNCPVIHYFYGRLSRRLKNNGGTFFFDGPVEILNKIKNARYIVSDSFHFTVFSIIYGKEFATFPSAKWSERMENLLNEYDLNDHLIRGEQNG